MSHQRTLTSKFNMSLGFIPVIISILLCEFMMPDISIYIGTGVGLLFCFYLLPRKSLHIPQIIWRATTAVLLLLSVTALLVDDYCPREMLPFALEIVTIIPPLIIVVNRKRFIEYHRLQASQCGKQLFAQGAEAAIVSSKVVLIVGLLHFLIIIGVLLFSHPLGETTRFVLFRVAPPVVFVLAILFNQIGIYYFNLVMKNTPFFPVVNLKGDVIGKEMAVDVINKKSHSIHPVIRIAVASHGLLFLLPRPQCHCFDAGKTDLLMEGYLLYEETLEQGAERIVQQVLPKAVRSELSFNTVYHFENGDTNRLVYLFLLDVEDDSILCDYRFKDAKLWTFQQIEQNLNQNFFGNCFEHEYEVLKSIIYTREKYKES